MSMGLKRGVMYLVFTVIVVLLFGVSLLSSNADTIGYCANPYLLDGSQVCGTNPISQEVCCPLETTPIGQRYGTATFGPTSQEDCQTNYFKTNPDDLVTSLKCDFGCCYNPTTGCTEEGTITRAMCLRHSQATFGTSCSAIQVNGTEVCKEICCAYQREGVWVNETKFLGQCNALSGLVSDRQPVAPLCAAVSTAQRPSGGTPQGQGNLPPECNGDPLCGRDLCNQGAISSSYTSSSPCTCVQYNVANGQRVYITPGVPCTADKYCCSGSCQDTPCATAGQCNPGEQKLLSIDIQGCNIISVCKPDGSWDTTSITQCPQLREVCNDAIDNNRNNIIDCMDPQCFNLPCNPANSLSCANRGYTIFGLDGTRSILCCNQEPRDCTGDGIKETCGPCDCMLEGQRRAPTITRINRERGVSSLEIVWQFNCAVPLKLLRCEGGDAICSSPFAVWYYINHMNPPEDLIGVTRYVDDTIEASKNYCYKAEARYPSGNPFTSAQVCVSTGDEFCMTHDEPQFCMYPSSTGLSFEPVTGTRRIVKAYCDESNTVMELGRCNANNELCMGPYAYNTVRCIYQSVCSECSDPFGMFAIFQDSKAKQEPNSRPSLCKDLLTCYYDYTDTIKDTFHECSEVNTCYDYRSEQACTSNKCLTRPCRWVHQSGSVTHGYCEEQNPRYKKCEYCNIAKHNNIFDACTRDKCAEFNEGQCFLGRNPLSPSQRLCKDKKDMTCMDYISRTECVGEHYGVQYDVNYDKYAPGGKRINGTNSILTQSDDALQLKKCYWDINTNQCFKDGNGDHCADGNTGCAEKYEFGDKAQLDFMAPQTILMPPYKVRAVNATVVVTDPTISGKVPSGPWQTYLCVDNPNCYPQKEDALPGLPGSTRYNLKLGLGQGVHLFRMYSIDRALNIEEVKDFTMEVDRKPPAINVTQFIVGQTTTASNVSFEIKTDENAYCKDNLEGQLGSHIPSYLNTIFQTQPYYTSLPDGIYFYKVNCTDELNNTGNAYKILVLNADNAISTARPFGVIDSLPVQLGISTISNYGSRCKFGVKQQGRTPRYNDLRYYFDGPESYTSNGITYYSYTKNYDTITSDGTYMFDVMCNLGSREAYDEIQFVYDTTPPKTVLMDAFGNIFNLSGFYKNIDKEIYLSCKDTPEFGFGCNNTYYCLSDTGGCDPLNQSQGNISDPLQPLRINITVQSGKTLCYQSVENVLNNHGGKREQVQCYTLQEDSQAPQIIVTYPDITQIPVLVSDNPITLTGEVRDPDAVGRGGVPHNTIIMRVSREDNGQTLNYTLDANPFFQQEIVLSRANTLTHVSMTAFDRVGSIATTDFDVKVIEYNDTLIQLVSPPGYYINGALHGVAPNKTFALVLQTNYPSQCKISYINQIYGSMPIALTRTDSSKKHVHPTFNLAADIPSQPVEIFAGCKRTAAGFTEEIDYKSFFLSWSNQTPEITQFELDNTDGKDPPTVVEPLLPTNLLVTTNMPVRCKYSKNYNEEYIHMNFFPDEETQLSINHSLSLTNEFQDFAHYIYYVQCESGSGQLTTKKSLSFYVNSTKFSGLKLVTPPRYTSNTTFALQLTTSKTSTACYYGDATLINQTLISDSSKKRHFSTQITLSQGIYTYYFRCIFPQEGWVSDHFDFTVDTTPPILVRIEDGNYSFSTQTLSANWEFLDNESGVVEYSYSLGSSLGAVDVVNWTATSLNTITLSDINLTDKQTYYWNVKARNKVDLWSTPISSDGVIVDTTTIPNTTRPEDKPPCENTLKDNTESDVDCGGECDKCGYGKRCNDDSDCFSLKCQDNLCQEATCNDRLKNGHESDIDCGGPCSRCAVGKTCDNNHDNCESGYCKDNVCQESSCSDGERNGVEEGVDCGGICDKPCFIEKPPSCSDGIQNQNEAGIDCGGSCSKKCETEKMLPTSWWVYALLILIILVVAGGGGYYFYTMYYSKHLPQAEPMQQTRVQRGQPIQQGKPVQRGKMQATRPTKVAGQPDELTPEQLAQLRRQREATKKKELETLFSKFEEKAPSEEGREIEGEIKAGEKLKLKDFEGESKPTKKK